MSNPAATEDYSLDEYLQWACGAACGVQLHHLVSLRATKEGERGLFTSETLPPSTEVLSLPFSSMLTIASFDEVGPLGPLLQQRPPLREDDILIIALLWEKSLGDKSKWAPHIAVLPSYVPSAVTLTVEGIERLQGSGLHPVAAQLQGQTESDWQELLTRRLICPVGETEAVAMSSFPWFTLPAYRWALSIIWSRCVTINRKGRPLKSICPFFDMLNHSPTTTMVHGFTEGDDDRLVLMTGPKEVPPGELCISYGPLSNLRLLLLYGFTLPDNPHETVSLWASMSTQAPHYETKAMILQRCGLGEYLTRPFELSLRDPLPQCLWASLRIQHATLDELSGAEEHTMSGGGPLSPRNEQEVNEVLMAALSGMLEGMGPPPPAAEGEDGDDWERYKGSERSILRAALHQLRLRQEEQQQQQPREAD